MNYFYTICNVCNNQSIQKKYAINLCEQPTYYHSPHKKLIVKKKKGYIRTKKKV